MVDIVHRVGIGAPIARVYETLTTLDGTRGWWDSSATGNTTKGGVITFFKKVDMKVLETKPNELVKWKCTNGPEEWMNTEVIFHLVSKEDQTFVLFTHAGWAKAVEFIGRA